MLVDGWYRTGDLADADDEGYLTIVGRARDVIRTGGETVAPAEVEAVLASTQAWPTWLWSACPTRSGARWCAPWWCPSPAPTLRRSTTLRAHCDGRLVAHKHPRRIEIVDAIPRTSPTNQVQRRLIVELFS